MIIAPSINPQKNFFNERSKAQTKQNSKRVYSPQVLASFTMRRVSDIGRETNQFLNKEIINPLHDMVKIPKP